MMVDLRQRGEAVAFSVRVVPRASRNKIEGIKDGAVRIRLTAPPVEGAANEALIGFLSSVLRVPKQDIELVSGQTARNKVVSVSGLSAEEIEARLRSHL
ncbi:MAG: DUF167 domain-containing protein [Anaerolineae bacterium]|jgi:uncharacterized protein (TIGR00251 family)